MAVGLEDSKGVLLRENGDKPCKITDVKRVPFLKGLELHDASVKVEEFGISVGYKRVGRICREVSFAE